MSEKGNTHTALENKLLAKQQQIDMTTISIESQRKSS
jgi:hypothetical protein